MIFTQLKMYSGYEHSDYSIAMASNFGRRMSGDLETCYVPFRVFTLPNKMQNEWWYWLLSCLGTTTRYFNQIFFPS